MRTPNLGSAFYVPGVPPEDPRQLIRFLEDELTKLAGVVDALAAGHLDMLTVMPTKPRNGDIRYFDGINAKPNGTGGVGVWYYNGASWVQLG